VAPSVSKYLIYALVDPRSGQWRYIGKSTSGLRRPKAHGRPSSLAEGGNRHKDRWIRQLHDLGLSYDIEVLEDFPTSAGLEGAEIEWIAAARAAGVPLTNQTDGGDGLLGRPHSRETRLKMSLSAGGLSEEARQGLIALYQSGASMRSAGQAFGVKSNVALSILRAAGVPIRSKQEARSRAVAMGRPPGSRRRPLVDQNGVRYETQGDAARRLNVPQGCISNVLKGKRPHTHGLSFRYLEAA
jgi:hypothetical protein